MTACFLPSFYSAELNFLHFKKFLQQKSFIYINIYIILIYIYKCMCCNFYIYVYIYIYYPLRLTEVGIGGPAHTGLLKLKQVNLTSAYRFGPTNPPDLGLRAGML